jgi:hypothetical protein
VVGPETTGNEYQARPKKTGANGLAATYFVRECIAEIQIQRISQGETRLRRLW